MNIKFNIIILISFFLVTSMYGQKKANLEGIEIGKIAPEIELPTVGGEDFKLSQLEGKLVLVNFWASWCAPCRKKAPEMIEIFEKYNEVKFDDGESGFEIVYVSLDKNHVAWERSIEKDGIDAFYNVGDMKGWKSATAKTYNIRKVPTSLLLDGKGKVIALNLSPQDLKKKLKRMKKGGWFWF